MNADFKIEKNIPIPNSAVRGRTRKYPLDKMEIGDSFFVDYESSGYKELSILHNSVNTAKRLYVSLNKDKEFAVRKVEDKAGVRVWRIK